MIMFYDTIITQLHVQIITYITYHNNYLLTSF